MYKEKIGKVLGKVHGDDRKDDPLVFDTIKDFIIMSLKHGNCTVKMERTDDDFIKNQFTIIGYYYKQD